MEHERAVHNLAVESYLLGEMAADEREAFETHYFECAVCAEDLRAASQFMQDAKDVLAAERARSPRAGDVPDGGSRWKWMSWLQPQFAAAMIVVLAIVAGVETLGTIPKLERRVEEAAAPRIVNTTVLREQTRGEPTPLRSVSGEPAVLRFDLPESPPADLRFIVKSADGTALLQLTGKTSGVGETMTLSMPKLDLPAGNYTLVVEASPTKGQSAQELGQYRFEVKNAL